jgi:hypothetical protein
MSFALAIAAAADAANAYVSPRDLISHLEGRLGDGAVTVNGKRALRKVFPCKAAVIDYDNGSVGRAMLGVIFDMPARISRTGRGHGGFGGQRPFWEYDETFYDGPLDRAAMGQLNGEAVKVFATQGSFTCLLEGTIGSVATKLEVGSRNFQITSVFTCPTSVSVKIHSCLNIQ